MSQPVLTTVDDATFEGRVLSHRGRSVVLFEADWSGACHISVLQLTGLEGHVAQDVRFFRLDVERSPRTSAVYGIPSVPTLVFFRDGRAVARLQGTTSRQVILQRLASI